MNKKGVYKFEIIKTKKSPLRILFYILLLLWGAILMLEFTLINNILNIIYLLILVFLFKNSYIVENLGEIEIDYSENIISINNERYFLKDLSFFEIEINGYANQIKLDGLHFTIQSGLSNKISFLHNGERFLYNFRLRNRKSYKKLKFLLENGY